MSDQWISVATIADVEEGEPLAIEVNGLSLALYCVEGEYFCTDNICSHGYAILTDGWLEGHAIECPLHNGQFDIRTGRGLCPPITEPIRTYAVKLDDEAILIALP